jgi:DNA-binding CsgD family transcriptional regulator
MLPRLLTVAPSFSIREEKKVLSMNSNAKAMLGPEIFVRGGLLKAKDCAADLQRLIGSVTARGPRHETKPVAAIRISRPGAGDLLVHAAPLARSAPELFERAKAIVMIDDLDAPLTPKAGLLRQVFGLTSAEAAIATAGSSGRELDKIAHARGVSLGTLRNQLKTIFAKTGAAVRPNWSHCSCATLGPPNGKMMCDLAPKVR